MLDLYINSIFTARSSYAMAVLGIVILSVCPSNTCFVTKRKKYCRYFDTIWNGHHSNYYRRQRSVGDVSFHLKFGLKVTHNSLRKNPTSTNIDLRRHNRKS